MLRVRVCRPQVQLLQLPVATLTQQCAELSSKLAGLSEWQHQAQAELARLAAAPARTSDAPNGEGLSGKCTCVSK